MNEVFISPPHKSHSLDDSMQFNIVLPFHLVDGCSQRPPTLSGWTDGPPGSIWCRWPWQALLHRLRSALQ